MTKEDILKARELIAATTPGPWIFNGYSAIHAQYHTLYDFDDGDHLGPILSHLDIMCGDTGTKQAMADCGFVCAARTMLPDALDNIERYQEALRDANKCYAEMMQERDKLRAVAEAATKLSERCQDSESSWWLHWEDTEEALKAAGYLK